jgi:heterodisulfide reductase subunit A
MMEKIGVFICECGTNIKDAMHCDEVVRFAKNLEHVALVESYGVLCSAGGKALIEQQIKAHRLTRVVIAACSPKEHEMTFRSVLNEAGLNGFLLQMANIREHCAWVTEDKAQCTEKAKAIVKAAVDRVVYHEPLEIKKIESRPDVLVIGAGITGIRTALTLAHDKRKVYLVEKLPFIGGKVARYEKVFPNLECASCLIDPMLDELLHHEHIDLLTLSRIKEVNGFYGNFIVTVKQEARFVDSEKCLGCGVCFDVCPVEIPNEYNEGLDSCKAINIPFAGILPSVAVIDKEHCLHFNEDGCNACQQACPFDAIRYEEPDHLNELKVGAIVLATGFDIFDPKKAPQYGYGRIENVYTALEFERLLNSTGPTGGHIVLKNGRPPQRIVLIHCVGSRSPQFNKYCSEVCCMYTLKFAHLIKENLPDACVIEICSDLCLPGKESTHFFKKLTGVEFLWMKSPDLIEIDQIGDQIEIAYTDVRGKSQKVTTDMVVLACGIQGVKENRKLADIMGLSQDEHGFFIEEDTLLAPVSTGVEGIYVAGCAAAPSNIQGSITQGLAAAGRILSSLIPGEMLSLEVMTAQIDEDLCSGCSICIGACPYKAIGKSEDGKRVRVNEVLCRGCGVCAVACPSAAIRCRHFTDDQVCAEIGGVIHGEF